MTLAATAAGHAGTVMALQCTSPRPSTAKPPPMTPRADPSESVV